MKGRFVQGQVRRVLDDAQQCIDVDVTATTSVLELLEAEVLTREGSWKWTLIGDSEPSYFTHRQFAIGKSSRGTISGANSNEENDFKSVSSGRSAVAPISRPSRSSSNASLMSQNDK